MFDSRPVSAQKVSRNPGRRIMRHGEMKAIAKFTLRTLQEGSISIVQID